MSLLEQLAVEHPYYCNESNYFSRDAGEVFDTATEFLDEWGDADIDMNLVFRWDVKLVDDDQPELGYCAEVFIMQQRKGIFMPVQISKISEAEAERFMKYLELHRQRLIELWAPLSTGVSS